MAAGALAEPCVPPSCELLARQLRKATQRCHEVEKQLAQAQRQCQELVLLRWAGGWVWLVGWLGWLLALRECLADARR